MASVSDSPPGSAGGNISNPVSISQSLPGSNDDRRESKLEAAKEASPASVFVNSEPIREEQVQNAVKFLGHPKVRGSPVMYRRSFLERKGLTKEEIDEAFRRLPDPSPAVTTAGPLANTEDGEIRPSSSQPPKQVLQPISAGRNSKMGMLSQFKWYHGIVALAFLATSGIGAGVLLKNSIIPSLKSWIRKVVLDEGEYVVKKGNVTENLAEETAVSVKAAAAAAGDAARASQEMLTYRVEEKQCFNELIRLLNEQAAEMKSMSDSLKKLESGQGVNGRSSGEAQDKQWFSISKPGSTPPYLNGGLTADSYSDRPSSPATAVDPSGPRHPHSYMEIMEMIRRGERPPNIRDINDAPPNPNQPVSNPRLAPRPKPWEVNQVSTNAYPVQGSGASSYHELTDSPLNADGAVPYWQQKNVRITEMEPDVEPPVGANPPRRSWVPPQPPPVMNPEAAAAIRQPKRAVNQTPTEQLTDEQLLGRSTSVSDELLRITKISESGGADETNGERSTASSTET